MKITVLLSGGLDSSTCLALAVSRYGSDNVSALCIHYGQKHDREINSARAVADYYKVNLTIMNLAEVFAGSNCSLMKNSSEAIEHRSYAEQLRDIGGAGMVSTYVPFRNGIMLSVAAGMAQIHGSSEVWYGAHLDDAAGRAYPDCSEEFVKHMGNAINEGTGGEIKLYAPFINRNKADIVKIGLELKVPYELTWSCYEGGEKPCGTCGTCIDRLNAFRLNNAVDPLMAE
ncbi:MAG: 7-cyano-7-deazaguanine synthase QueC [Ruminobacter sp.]|uniref:7-cyano-7-deazaguanine synthase QueC n=1 Tax=Ruminobacter TaxID=866 RepID=UPI0025801D9D|nr:7-cyano-7-deazaguanine synthase QueC [Ruminobacter sp.]MBQ3775968.1 7-cyano-7-deazaguanine synthase QueC [Ruminobacter sp.]